MPTQHLTLGQPNVLYYGSTLFKAAGFSSDRDATLANLFIGLVKVGIPMGSGCGLMMAVP